MIEQGIDNSPLNKVKSQWCSQTFFKVIIVKEPDKIIQTMIRSP